MRQFFYLPVICALFLAACTSGYKKGDNGIEYKIIADGSGNKLVSGNFIQMHITQQYKDKKLDTVLGNSRDMMPRIESFDSAGTPLAYFKILTQVRKGDSLVIRILTDSAYKDASPQQPMPPFMHKGGYIYTTVKVLNIFKTREEADSANAAEVKLARPMVKKKQMEEYIKQVAAVEKRLAGEKAQIDMDSKIIEDYLAKNNIKATKIKWGTYVAIHAEGTGDKITNESVATVNYTGKTLDSATVFDSNVDPKFQHVGPYEVIISQLGQSNSVIPGWIDALLQLKKGDKATLYLPSSLAYGKQGRMPTIKPDAILIFDMDVVDVATEEQMMAKAEENQKKMQEAQKAVIDSLQKASANKK